MTTCVLCGADYRFDLNIRHVCVASVPDPVPEPFSHYSEAVAEHWRQLYNEAAPNARGARPADVPSRAIRPHDVWISFLGHNLCGEFFILRQDMPADRQAMRQLLHERLQSCGDALMAEWEKHDWKAEREANEEGT